MNRPLELAHYLSTNDVLPPSGLPTLNSYLSQLTTTLEGLESDICNLQAILDAKKEEQRHLQQEYTTCASIKSPIRRLPPEILGLVFGFSVGAVPFDKYIHVAHLRGVCSSWRQAAMTTPGLWTGLTIDLDKWTHSETQACSEEMLLTQFKEELSPWMAILSRTHHFHLTLTSRSLDNNVEINDPGFNRQRKLVKHLLSMTPRPGALTLKSPLALLIVIDANAPSVTKLEISDEATRTLEGLTISEAHYPSLKALKVDSPLAIDHPPFPHSSLQTLHLVKGAKRGFFLQQLLQSLPSLRELRLDFPDDLDVWNAPAVPETTYVHQSLETLIIRGEDHLFTLRNLSFPRLRLLEIFGFASTAFEDDLLRTHIHPDTFGRSSSEPLVVSLAGDFYQLLLHRLLACLPPASHLHLDFGAITNRHQYNSQGDEENAWALPISIKSDNIESIFCGNEAVDLWWLLDSSPARDQSSRVLPIYLPTGFNGWRDGYLRRDKLLESNFALEPLPNETLEAMLWSLAPPLSKYAAGWWKPYLV
ncbi:hypothetical protein BKA70DRAFT_1267357 [Coprinopsis sp. MPI-PUGE-AT-0042]|nr:hypothetical protein BKA70DRAFT_1267357 [Coprinopsis sp. MPI-PUGE-AT-0042]